MQIALYKPEIPPNTGNIARLCVLTDSILHIIGKPAFSLSDKAVKRAGLDYWDQLSLHLHDDWDSFLIHKMISQNTIYLVSRFGKTTYSKPSFKKNNVFVFGNESAGLPAEIVSDFQMKNPQNILRIPVKKGVRSLNLSNAVAITVYEAFRQTGFENLEFELD